MTDSIKTSISGYGLVFKRVMKDKNLSIEAKGLYSYLSAYAGADESSFPSVSLIKYELNIGKQRYQRARKELEDTGYLVVTRKQNGNIYGSNLYTVMHEPRRVDSRPVDSQPVEIQSVDNQPTTINSSTINSNTNNNKTINNMSGNPTIPYQSIIEYLNEKTGKHYKHTTNKTKSFIEARWKEDFREEDFKKVIDIKVQEWKGTDQDKYLRPETLFGTKFEGYRNQQISNKESNDNPYANLF
ncbi:conserved phage C-terminal domain-containing protein [Staphylococcus equorum]|uniref:Conserved phage C-terminal domain-containing protein n=2 Tax=Staphylococcus equorum TaxID=246432 RepID=A0A9X4L6X7_9STAP|nr:conserved phage C-terminal domain-containing protein [Staphylococcus equorum]MDG0821121.1 conserved phage C-terminal domain-containing protein [Staphylococcus equorum]MDG0841776.1 conserved phage C-terminal domain-containing protein [Staphylococcus equorum]MDG0847490.1 conserved phage C-terminal domain-containing protein [Staphylococcus equorum]